MKRLSTLLFILVFAPFANSQIYDIFTNTIYDNILSYVFKEESDKEYLPHQFEIIHDHLGTPNFSEELYQEIRKIAVETLENELTFQLTFMEAQQQVRYFNQYLEEEGEYARLGAPLFKGLDIVAKSILNNQVIFEFEYRFETDNDSYYSGYELVVSRYYHVDLTQQKIKKFDPYLSKYTKTIPPIIREKLKRTYAISTQKVEMENIDSLNIDNSFETFMNSLDINKLKAIPYFSGMIIEFETGAMIKDAPYSSTIVWSEGDSFQLFLDHEEIQQLKLILPYFNQFYPPLSKIKPFNPRVIELKTLSENLIKSKTAIDFVLDNYDSSIHELEIKTFKLSDEKILAETESYTFTSTGKIKEYQKWRQDSVLQERMVYNYNQQDNLYSLIEFDHFNQIENVKIYYHSFSRLKQIESIYQDDEPRIRFGEDGVKIKEFEIAIENTYYFYNGNYLYTLNFPSMKDNNRDYSSMSVAYINDDKFCDGYRYVLFDKNNRILGIEQLKYAHHTAQLLTNESGQLLEYFYDNDRHRCYYEYDEKNRLVSEKKYYDNRLSTHYEYFYKNEDKIPFLIQEKGVRGDWERHLQIR